MTEKKQANYSKEQEAAMIERYQECKTEKSRLACVQNLADEFGKTVPSVRSKLVKLGVYIAKVYKTKTGSKPETKETIVSDIAACLGVDADSSIAGLEKATKNCLTLLRKTILIAQEALLIEPSESESESE